LPHDGYRPKLSAWVVEWFGAQFRGGDVTMIKVIALCKLTEKGQVLAPDKAPVVLAKTQEIAAAYGGKLKEIWATNGRYDFVVLAEYPDELAAFKAYVKINELGVFHMESATAFPVEAYIEALKESKVLVAV
jgi:uncharacterized protein with GYD domain